LQFPRAFGDPSQLSPDIQWRAGRLSRPLPIHFRPMGQPPPFRPLPLITVNQFRSATFQLPHGTPEELRRLSQDIARDLIDQSSPPISRGSITHHGPLEFHIPVQKPYESDHAFSLRILCEKRRSQKEMSKRAPITAVRESKERES
jgi:hypothetical protein